MKRDIGFTALHLAVCLGHSETCQLLLAAKASPAMRTEDQTTPLLLAALRGHANLGFFWGFDVVFVIFVGFYSLELCFSNGLFNGYGFYMVFLVCFALFFFCGLEARLPQVFLVLFLPRFLDHFWASDFVGPFRV